MSEVAGTKGYESAVEAFAESSLKLRFEEINEDFLNFLPECPARVLDAGVGVGQNSAALADLGFDVVAVEPLEDFLSLAKSKFTASNISWYKDSLPFLNKIPNSPSDFDFILVDGVFHHLDEVEQKKSISKFSHILKRGGVCALPLRNGPAGAGKHVFPTNSDELLEYVKELGFKVLLHLKKQPSKMKNKPKVTWDRVALRKIAGSQKSA